MFNIWKIGFMIASLNFLIFFYCLYFIVLCVWQASSVPYVLECVGEVAAGGVLAFLMEVHTCTGYSPHSLKLEYGSIFFKTVYLFSYTYVCSMYLLYMQYKIF